MWGHSLKEYEQPIAIGVKSAWEELHNNRIEPVFLLGVYSPRDS